MNLIRLIALVAVTMTLFACEQNKALDTAVAKVPAPAESNVDQKNELPGIADLDKEFEQDLTGQQQQTGNKQNQKADQQTTPPANPDWDKKIIKTASLNLEVKDYTAFSASLREKVKNYGGYVAQEDQSQSDYKIENSIMIKVPVDQFDNVVAGISGDAEKTNEKKISSQDVTGEMIDTRSRMEAKKQVRLRYLDLLKQAKNMEEILHVQSQVNGVQEEIESAAGRMQYLGHSSAFSTIHLTYYQILNSSAKEAEKPSFGTKLLFALKTGSGWFSDLFIALVSIWPLFLIAFGCVVIYKRTRPQKPGQA